MTAKTVGAVTPTAPPYRNPSKSRSGSDDLADRLEEVIGVGIELFEQSRQIGRIPKHLAGGVAGLARDRLTSLATTVKPLPASLARPASTVAWSASRLV